MEKLFQQANQLMNEAKDIKEDIFTHNPSYQCKKVPFRTIQYSVATLMREYSGLYAKIGEKIKDDS